MAINNSCCIQPPTIVLIYVPLSQFCMFRMSKSIFVTNFWGRHEFPFSLHTIMFVKMDHNNTYIWFEVVLLFMCLYLTSSDPKGFRPGRSTQGRAKKMSPNYIFSNILEKFYLIKSISIFEIFNSDILMAIINKIGV